MAWPRPIVVAELDEYDFINIVRTLAPELARQDREFGGLLERFEQSAANGDRESTFQRMFEGLMIHWLTAPAVLGELESWPSFQLASAPRPGSDLRTARRRPAHGGFHVRRLHRHCRASGPGCAGSTALELNWRSRNCSLTEFVFTRGRITLDSFNTVPHLTDTALWTYR